MSKIYKDHQYTLPTGITPTRKREENQTQKSKPPPGTFRRPVYTYTVDAGLVHQVHSSFIHRMIVRYMRQCKTYNPNVIGQSIIF